jgi:hypothetical protein
MPSAHNQSYHTSDVYEILKNIIIFLCLNFQNENVVTRQFAFLVS